MAGLFGSAVEVPRTEYTKLIRESEQLDMVRRLLKKNKYVSIEDLKIILCVEDEEAPKGEKQQEEKPEKQYSFEELLGEQKWLLKWLF